VYRELLVGQLAEVVRMPAGRLAELLEGGAPPETARGAGPSIRRSQPAAVVAHGRGNLVRQAISLLVHFPAAGAAVAAPDGLETVDRPGVQLLIDLLAQLREEPVATTGALLERWRERPDYPHLARLAATECLVPDPEAAAAEIRSALERLVSEHLLARLQVLEDKAREEPLTAEEKAELQGLLRSRLQTARPPAAK
jgi:DNA primase